ncbi:MAG: Crp/Fnr family transcriptional regulator [Bacteroidetes bacterium]|nr:Crp/Fnr family transcriptional regulator [Bacteroidota bacterium]
MIAKDLHAIEPLFEPELISEINAVGKVSTHERGQIMIDLGEEIKYIPILLDGAIKIVREDENGDELLLYFVEFGNTCALTLNCCIGNVSSEIRAICESDTRLIMIPVQYMDQWLSKYKSWRTFIFNNYQNRMVELLKAIDSITFKKLDQRLEQYLHEKANVSRKKELQITHLEIATDLNSSRVVISRLLKQMENEGTLQLGRNTIKLL